MANVTRNFTAGKMNKMVDERLVPNGQYIDALNVRMGSTEQAEIGVIENSFGNTQLTTLEFNSVELSSQARCIGAYEDGARETIYWFVHDKNYTSSPTGKLDMVVSYNTNTTIVTYHLISVNDGSGVNTTLNFNEDFLFTGVNMVEDMLFFTDNYNQPRKINIKRNYDEPSGAPLVDGFINEDILVIKKPPAAAPSISLVRTGGQENYLEERFICFGYRYKYADEEYSATSQFTSAAFVPNLFNYSPDNYLNEGVTNLFNTAEITFNTGGPLVIGIDLLFKDNASNVIKIIEKLTKSDQGYVDYQDVTFSFSSSKIFTILPDAEILRLFDNVPRYAQGQTIMGNRLMYGNYVEGYNMVDHNGNPVRFDYSLEAVKQTFEPEARDGVLSQGNYSIQGAQGYAGSVVTFDLNNLDLVEGAQLSFTFSFEHEFWAGDAPLPDDQNNGLNLPPIDVIFVFQLTQDYNSVYELATSDEFAAAIGTSLPGGNIEPMANASNGSTLTDQYNATFIGTISDGTTTVLKYQSGISAIEQAVQVTSSPATTEISFQFPAIQYADNVTTPTQICTEYFSINANDFEYSKAGNGRSLHSNRSYEIGILYMDEFNRTTPALVSQFDTFHFGCGDSATKNSLNVRIPTTQIAPAWAKRYKFACKPDKQTYDTIYTNIYFTDPNSSESYFLLEGENSQKVTDGQRFIVKADSSGPTQNCVFATVLEKQAQEKNFIEIPSEDDPDENIPVPAGTYMKIKANNFAVETTENAIIDFGCEKRTRKDSGCGYVVSYPVNLQGSDPNNPSFTHIDYDIPGGSRIVFNFVFNRNGYRGGDGNCERRRYELKKTLTASQEYDSFLEWFEGDNIQAVLKQGFQSVGGSGGPIENEYEGQLTSSGNLSCSVGTNYYGIYRNPTTNQLLFQARGTKSCTSSTWRKNGRSSTKLCITVFRAENTFIFESEPLDASPDIWFEGAETFDIVSTDNICQFDLSVALAEPDPIAFNYTDINGFAQTVEVGPDNNKTVTGVCGSLSISPATTPINPANVTIVSTSLDRGNHLGNIQNQTSAQDALVSSGFFNCFSFGNGAESYKIRDSILGKELKLGNRVTSTQNEDYAEVRRFADITYSGVFNDESNVNKLNEFNAGNLNFKALEESFGPIQKLFARETDVLTLQEDKISYVLAGKNLLSDAGAGSNLISVPEVLGTQIARVEEFGISHNPESFAQYGADRFFTDAKRGVVLQLSGTTYANDQLTNISQLGMRSWFRDLFNEQFEKQKLGGFDPYMNEFVLSANQQDIPMPKDCINCGITQNISITSTEPFDNCFELGQDVGPVLISWVAGKGTGTFDVAATYSGTTVSATNQTSSGSITVNKNNVNITDMDLLITTTGTQNLTITVACPDAKSITLVEVCVTSANEQGLLVHNEHRFVDGTYVSPLTSTQVSFGQGSTNPIVTFYQTTLGNQGAGPIPTTGSQETLAFRKMQGDTAVFDEATNKFRYLASATQYVNTPQSVAQLIAASSHTTTDVSQGPNYYKGSFAMPSINDGEYLYIIYDYRKPTLIDLCNGPDAVAACCGCTTI